VILGPLRNAHDIFGFWPIEPTTKGGLAAMDPASASVAFIGFAASLTTLVALVLDASTTVYNAQRLFRRAPDDIRRLSTQLIHFERLLREIQEQIQGHSDGGVTAEVATLLTSATDQMHADMASFKLVIQKLNAVLSAPAAHKKLLALRLRFILQAGMVQEYQRMTSSHIEVLTLLVGMLNR